MGLLVLLRCVIVDQIQNGGPALPLHSQLLRESYIHYGMGTTAYSRPHGIFASKRMEKLRNHKTDNASTRRGGADKRVFATTSTSEMPIVNELHIKFVQQFLASKHVNRRKRTTKHSEASAEKQTASAFEAFLAKIPMVLKNAKMLWEFIVSSANSLTLDSKDVWYWSCPPN